MIPMISVGARALLIQDHDARHAAGLAARAATPRASLRDAAAAILAAWDDEANRAGDMIGTLAAPMEALRDALARKPGRPMR